jgi:hypothetical protein
MAGNYRTKGATATELVGIITALEKQVADNMLILALIAFNQPDKVFTVSIPELQELPQGASVDVSFNKKTQAYEFRYVAPDAPPLEVTPSLIEVPGLKIT